MAKKEKPFTVQMKEQVLASKKQGIIKEAHKEYSVCKKCDARQKLKKGDKYKKCGSYCATYDICPNSDPLSLICIVVAIFSNLIFWYNDFDVMFTHYFWLFLSVFPSVFVVYIRFLRPVLEKRKLARKKQDELEQKISKLPVLAENYYNMKLQSIEQELVGPQSKLFLQLSEINENLEQLQQFKAKFSMAINNTRCAGLDPCDLIEDLESIQANIGELEELRSRYEVIRASIQEFLSGQRTKCASLELPLRNSQLRNDVRAVIDRGQQTIDRSEQLLFEIAEELDTKCQVLKQGIQQKVLQTGVDSALQSARTGRFIQDMQTIDRELQQTVDVAVG